MPEADDRILKLNQVLRETAASIRALHESFRLAEQGYQGQLRDANLLIEAHQRLNRVLAERVRVQSLPRPAVSGGSPNQAGYGQPPLEPKVTATSIDLSNLIQTEKQKQLAANKRVTKASQREAEEAERVANLRSRVANDPRFREYISQLESRGLGIEDIQSATSRGGGITQVMAARNQGGIMNKYQAYVNEATGASTPGLSSQFRSAGRDILRDIGQFTKWSIAIAAVYTPMQKLGELITIMIDNESRLADATIAANVPFEKSGEIFDTVAESANQAGESINTTIDAYTQAIRAVGGITDASQKQVAAVKLLNDSLILSKLSTLDQASAIDTLSAALLQSDRKFTDGTELLNKWIRVSQLANVDLTTLATGVAVLGDSAETVGLSIDQLNGLIAVLAQNSISGAKEAANTAKALVGAYQSDKAEATLNKYGIALRKANGEVKQFLDIYQELSKLRQQGVLSDAAVSEVALALGGGGVRRAKDASALINSTDKLNEIAAESAKITGQDTLAQDALSKKLETVQTANTRLANSFQELAQTLGDKGGLLDLFKSIVDALTAMTKGADELFGLLGRSGPILTAFTGSLVALNSISAGRRGAMLANLGAMPTQFMGFMGGQAQFGGPMQNVPGMGYGKGLLADILRMNTRGGLVLGGAGVAAQGLSNIQAGRNEQAIGNVVGGAIGAAIGAYLGGPMGIAVGANIGAAAGDAMVTSLLTHKGDFGSIFAPTPTKGEVDLSGLAGFLFGKAAPPTKPFSELSDEELKKILYQGAGGGNELAGSIGSLWKYAMNTPKIFGVAQGGGFGNQNAAALDTLKKQNPALYQQFMQEQYRREAVNAAQTNVQNPLGGQYEGLRGQLEAQATQERQRQLQRLATGKITTSEFGRISGQISGFPSTAIQSVTAYGNEFMKVSKDINTTKDAYDAFLYIATNGTQDQINLLSQYSNDINTLKGYIDNWKPELKGVKLALSFGDVTVESLDQLQKLMGNLQTQGGQAAAATYSQIRFNQIKLPGIVGEVTKPTTGSDVDIIKNQAQKLQEQFYTDMNLTNDEIEQMRKSLEDFSVYVERAGEDHFETISGIDQKFWDAAQKLLMEQGKLREQRGIGFQKFDIPMSQLEMLAGRSLQIGQSWQQKYNYDFKPEDQIAIDNQGIVQPLHADFKILALLLEKLNEKAQKQLDGQYNIPEGATFWVPLTAAYYRNKGEGAGGDLNSMLNALDLKDNTGATTQNTTAVQNLTDAMQNRKEDMVEGWQKKHFGPSDTVNKGYERKINRMETAEGLASQAKAEAALGYRGDYGYAPRQGERTGIQNRIPGLESSPFNKTGQTQQVNTAPTTKLDIKFSANTNLILDGRVLATAIQSYLASELVRTEQSQGTITKRYVI